MKFHAVRSLALLAVVAAGAVVAVPSPPAEAVTETSEILVTSQYGGAGCANNQRLIVANPFTGNLISNRGTPNTNFDQLNEAKPYSSNSKIVALWGGSNTTDKRAGVGVYDRVASAWTTSFFIPTTFQVGSNSPHSITVLPDGWFAVAQVGTISGASGSGFVVLFSPTGVKGNHYPLSSAHGVEYDPRNGGNVYAVGANDLMKYTYDSVNHTLTTVTTYDLPGTGPGGHDLRRRRNDNKYSVTTNVGSHIFDPANGSFSTLTRTDGSALGGGVKSIDQRFDGVTEYNYYDQNPDVFRFLDGTGHNATFCTNFYKAGRWLYAIGDPDFNGDGTPPPPATTWSPTFTVGSGANSWWIEIYASSDVASVDVIGKNGQFFMSNLTKQSWGAFAQSPPQEMVSGSLIKLIGRKADGSSAGSETFAWLQKTNPTTETGWNASFTIHQCSVTLSATISSAAVAAKVRIGTADWATMTQNAVTQRWERAGGVPLGTKYLIRAYLAPGTEAAPQAYDLIRTC